MDYATATTKHVRVPPRKARLAADLIRGLSVTQAQEQLTFGQMKGARLLLKTLNSAIANAETQNEWRREDLFVVSVRVNEGPRLKRAKPKNRGGKHPIIKRTSHFTVDVGTKEGAE